MNKQKKMLCLIGFWLFILFSGRFAYAEEQTLSQEKLQNIEAFILKNIKKGKIPGASVVIVQGNRTVYTKSFGYKNGEKQPVDSFTYFELGSNSKAFTALGIYYLAQQHLISLDDPVSHYLPWLSLEYKGTPADVTIKHCLYHTSGIPFETIKDIPAGDDDKALERTVRTLLGTELTALPGEEYLYATINYDILGLIIEKVSNESYEQFMRDKILSVFDLDTISLFPDTIQQNQLARGYKLSFLFPREYQAPPFRGNKPAGYLLANSLAMEKWLKIQLGSIETGDEAASLIKLSHGVNRKVPPSPRGSSYGGGWDFYQIGDGEYSHLGYNPNFSSYIGFRPGEQIGVALLCNLSTPYSEYIGQGVLNLLVEKDVPKRPQDPLKSLDRVMSLLLIVGIIIFLISLFFMIRILLLKNKRLIIKEKIFNVFFNFIGMLFILAGAAYCVFLMPQIFVKGAGWDFVIVWLPFSFPAAILALFAGITLFSLYIFIQSCIEITAKDDNQLVYFSLVVLSLISGLGNAIVIFIINESFNRLSKFDSVLLIYFFVGLFLYIIGQKFVRTRLINITNTIIYKKRVQMIKKLLNASFLRIESLGDGEIYAGLNNDTEVISNFANIFITGVTSIITLVFCFIYLGMIKLTGLAISIGVIIFAAGLYFFVSQSAQKLWESTRDIQNVFFGFITDLVSGFKQLLIHEQKKSDFQEDMKSSCREYKEKRIKGDLRFAYAFIVGELVFTLVIGFSAFFFPVLFKNIESGSIRSFVFVFLYMTGPVNAVLNMIPNVVQMKISWGRINRFIDHLSDIRHTEDEFLLENNVSSKSAKKEGFELKLSGVEYAYKSDEKHSFRIHPINFKFKSNELTFITGGNGSGKSTLAKLITGLYLPDSGTIMINDQKISSKQLRESYSVIFSDYHLFNKLYGIDIEGKEEEIKNLLKILDIEHKVSIENNEFSTTRLSSGQKKRLALLISYLEDKPIYLFDEWAAEQDPEFRSFFYRELLPALKERGKCVIVISHDDKYFDIADNTIKMEMGRLVT